MAPGVKGRGQSPETHHQYTQNAGKEEKVVQQAETHTRRKHKEKREQSQTRDTKGENKKGKERHKRKPTTHKPKGRRINQVNQPRNTKRKRTSGRREHGNSRGGKGEKFQTSAKMMEPFDTQTYHCTRSGVRRQYLVWSASSPSFTSFSPLRSLTLLVTSVLFPGSPLLLDLSEGLA
jgi:hypothetical protein